MVPSSITRISLFLILLSAAAGTALYAGPAAPARAASPSITAIGDAQTYGVLVVTGQGFTPRTTATVQVQNAATGALLNGTQVRVNSLGKFTGTVSFTVSSNAPLVDSVAIMAIDASQAVTDSLVVALNPPVRLVQEHQAGVQQTLAAARAQASYLIGVVAQTGAQEAAAQQALDIALQNGAPPDVIRRLQALLDAAIQAFQAALQELAAANATIAQLGAAAGTS